jgi:biotin carboxylase
VVVGSERRQALAGANPAGHLVLDFLRIDQAAARIVEFHREHPLRAVVAADDDGAVLAAVAAAALGLPHAAVEAVAAARDKHRMRVMLRDGGVPSPEFRRLSIDDDPAHAAAIASYPCVLKPLFLSGSRGVVRADDRRQFAAAFATIRSILQIEEVSALGGELARWVLVEAYIPGFEVALEGLVSDGRLKILALYDKPDPLEGPCFEETLYVTPSRHPEDAQRQVVDVVRGALAALGLRHGPVHAEARVNARGAWIVEIAPRSIGGLCSRTLRFGDGISLEELILRHAVGRDVANLERERAAAGVMMIPIPRPGMLRAVRGRDEARAVPAVEDVRITVPTGGHVAPPPEGNRYLGFIFARAETPGEVENALRLAHSRLEFVFDERS